MAGWLIALLTLVFLVMSAILGMLVRSVQKFTRVEVRQDVLIRDVSALVESKDKTHQAMLEQMRLDRDATNQRLRYIEEWFMTTHGRIR